MPPRRLQHVSERMDEPGLDEGLLARDLRHIEHVNAWLGGLRAVRALLRSRLRPGARLTLLDVACGSGDVVRSIAGLARAHRAQVRIVALDRHPQILAIARARTPASLPITFVRADALALPFPDGHFDVVLMSLALHHFEGDACTRVLRELVRVAQGRVVVNELERCWPNYLGAKLLAGTVWRGNSLARHDGPVSVLRAFTPEELRAALRSAGLEDVNVKRRFFYRLVGLGSPRAAKSAAAATLA